MIVLPVAARRERLLQWARQAESVRLFANDYRPGAASRAQDFVEPLPATGYAPIAAGRLDWRDEAAGTTARVTSRPYAWVFAAGRAAIWGYYVLGPGRTVMLAERFAEPYEVLRAGDELVVVIALDDVDLGDAR